jgi:chromosome segregation protein
MRLQRLEINGFKSFSDRSELAFDQGVTAIVGPNGCGKSNVADAITWVMGEQSAKSLRGERMEDVIFSGSDARKPTAAAEVRLRFSGFVKQIADAPLPAVHAVPVEDGNGQAEHHRNGSGNGNGSANGHRDGNGNGHPASGNGYEIEAALTVPSPHAVELGGSVAPTFTTLATFTPAADEIIQSIAREVEVTRRLYRSGESEYLIDGRVCRLRDVHDLLMDTGLGAKAYAIIEQGKIGLILSSRPTDRRQLIEEAAGITKYKARRRAAELKLEAAQQNLTRIDDIVFEVEKQRGTLKRQAAKARRYQKLRDELRRWEKVLFARKYRQLSETIASARAKLADARERESVAAARVAQVEADLGRFRIELVEAETAATRTREAAHARELDINRRQQQLVFDREQVQSLGTRSAVVAGELDALESRREPAKRHLEERRQAAAGADADRDRAAASLAAESGAYEAAHREIEGLEADVEAARSEVFSAINSATALRHALEHASAARDKVADTLSKLAVETDDARIEADRVAAQKTAAAEGLKRTHDAIEATRIARTARESELASARIEHEWRSRTVRAREHDLAAFAARLQSLEELDAARAGYGDAPRAVLAQANGTVCQQGALADYLEVDAGYERAVDAYLGDLLEHVVVERPEHAAAGFQIVRDAAAGRCGFVITSAASRLSVGEQVEHARPLNTVDDAPPEGLVSLSSVVRLKGPYADALRGAIADCWIAPTYDRAADASALTSRPVATVEGDVFRGPSLVSGGARAEARGILETRREIAQLRDRIASDRQALFRLSQETAELDAAIAHASNAIAALNAEHHRQDKALVGFESQAQHAVDELARLAQKTEQLAREFRQAEEERDALDRRQLEAREAIERLEAAQHDAEERLNGAQRRLFEAREATEELGRRAAEAGAVHAALVERAGALESEVRRLAEAEADLEQRAIALATERDAARARVEELKAAIQSSVAQLDEDVADLDSLRQQVMTADDAVTALRAKADEYEATIKEARAVLDAERAAVSSLDVARATAEADLSHLAHTCEDAVNATLDQVVVEVEAMEQSGQATPDASVIAGEETEDEDAAEVQLKPDTTAKVMTAEEAIAALRGKIERLGPVNMMAIEQFEELETRHAFLAKERGDLVASIAQTSEAIKRIDETTRQRFSEAFNAINVNFQQTFSTLFGGGRAGLTLLDETDPLESGIEIVAQPPGKRLQSVQLLSGGEKALTAIALMFGMFKFKPSPFCLLDEIDAPLDDANIGRFVEMLRGMQAHTQFIVITHNRKTMEIADRLYGVTMEEPGVSKLISLQLN